MKTYMTPETAVADFVIAKTVLMASGGVDPKNVNTDEYDGSSPIKIL